MAADALRGSADPRIFEPLREAARSDDPDLRLSAARTLAEAAALLSAEAAKLALEDPEIPTRRALDLLGQPLAHTVRALFRALDDPDPLVQSHAAGLLASVPHAAAIRTLRALLADEQTELIAAAILATVGDESSEERIISVLADVHEPPERRWIAARSAIHIDDDRARQALRDVLADGDLVDAWRESDSAGDVPRLLELAAASPSEELRAAASAAQERITAEAGAHEDLSGDVADLVDPDPHSRQAARRNFIEGDAPVRVQDLITLVESHFDDGTDLSHVVEVLGHLADPAATAVLARLLGHDNWETRGFAVTALGALGDDAVDPLCEALHRDPELMVRARAVKSLERFEGNPRAGAVITRAVLGDPTLAEDWDERVVRPAGRALGQMDYRDAIPDLIAALEHDCAPPVQRSVAWALGELRAAESANALRELLEDDPVEPVQRAVAWALGVIRDPEAVPILLRVLEEAADVATRSEAAFALGEIKDPAAIPALLAALDGSSGITSRAAWALGQLRANEAIGPLLEALRRETDSETRAAIIHAVGELDATEATREFESLATGPDERERRAAVHALGRIGDAHSVEVLHGVAASDRSQAVRLAALRALKDLRGRLHAASPRDAAGKT